MEGEASESDDEEFTPNPQNTAQNIKVLKSDWKYLFGQTIWWYKKEATCLKLYYLFLKNIIKKKIK